MNHRKRIDELLIQHWSATTAVKMECLLLAGAEKEVEDTEEAQHIIQTVAQSVQQVVHNRIAGIVSSCLETIFGVERKRDVCTVSKSRNSGISKVSSRERRQPLEIDKSERVDKEKAGEIEIQYGDISISSRNADEKFLNRPSSTDSLHGTKARGERMLSRPRSKSRKQQSKESTMGNSPREYDGSQATRKRTSETELETSTKNKKVVSDGKAYDATVSRHIQDVDRDHSSTNPMEDMENEGIKGAYQFRIEFGRKRGRTEARLLFVRDGEEIDPISASGGGVVDVTAFALRLACLILTRPAVRRLIVLDEPFKHLSAEYRVRVRSMLEGLAEQMDTQIILVTHSTEFHIGKVVEVG